MEEIDIPSHFLCPISLQLMRDPVIVSTGITYDRENIERWLFLSKNYTCPVTKQTLLETDLIPNHTLRRLIQSWCILNASHGIERIPTPKPLLNKTQIIKILDNTRKSPQHLRKLRSMVLESERNRTFIEASGALEVLASMMRHYDDTNITERAIEVIYNLKSSAQNLKNLVTKHPDFIDFLLLALKHGSYQSRAHTTIVLKSIYDVADPILLISANRELFAEVVRVLHDQISQQASKAALKLLVELCPWGRNRIKAVEGSAVFVLIELLLDTSERRTCELALMVLDQLCGCAEGRAKMLEHGGGVAIVSKKILRISHEASDRAVRILCSICRFSATARVVQEMVEVGVVSKLCLVLQVGCALKTKERARDVLKLHSSVWKNSPCVPHHLLASYPHS